MQKEPEHAEREAWDPGAHVREIRAAVVRQKGGPFEIETLHLDGPRPDEVLVRIVATGICQTDAHVRDQHSPGPLPMVLGHEGAGVVEQVGSGVTTVVPGDHVALSYQSCGQCHFCLSGKPAYCEHGLELCFGGQRLDGTNALAREGVHAHFFGQSSFASYALATERNVVKVPKDVPLELMGPLGCGMQTGAGAVLNSLKVPAGASIALFGTGGVGLAAVMAARIAGANVIIAVDVSDQRLTLATELGATHTINGGTGNVRERIMEITGSGVDYVLEMTARPEMLKLAVDVVVLMGTVGLIGGAPAGTEASIDMNQLLVGRTIRGIVQGDSVPQIFIPELVEMYKAGKFPFDRLVRFYDFENINQAFADTTSGQTIKPILRIGRQDPSTATQE
jgi:aryl-alcohol dehydrogenase